MINTRNAILPLLLSLASVAFGQRNAKPQITGQVALSTQSGEEITLELSHLTVVDPDNEYPQDFTLRVSDGQNYDRDGRTITPDDDFSGTLTVRVRVDDGDDESEWFDLKIEVAGSSNNISPIITGQRELSAQGNQSITIELTDLIVTDPDNEYPQDFTLRVSDGQNYDRDGRTITPDDNFSGTLTVRVRVDDGDDESEWFDLKIEVAGSSNNIRPIITGQQELSTIENQSITLELADLIVTDPDNEYPQDFTLRVSNGQNYNRNGRTITPDNNFIGTLTVPVRVDDGDDESERFDLKIEVHDPTNVPPVITGQDELSTNEDQSIILQHSNLNVTDPDDDYPNGFIIKISPGTNHTVSGNRILPNQNFFGTLTVNVIVNDGKNDSNPFLLNILVRAVNDAPVITGQKALTTLINTSITIQLSDLFVTDPDNKYPDGFSLNITSGFNYKVLGNSISPASNFQGTLRVNATVSDGAINSRTFEIEIRVISMPNVAPIIIGQQAISITINSKLTIQFSHLQVTDPDNQFPDDYTLSVLSGTNYSLSGTTIAPTQGFAGTLSVRVTVNDGTVNSNIFNLQVVVIPISVKPIIIGQTQLLMDEDESITIQLEDLVVSDADDVYPGGFQLQVLAGKDYTTKGQIVTPALNINGFLAVGVIVIDERNNASVPFSLVILINPVNDPPVITKFENTPISYEPGTSPISLATIFEIEDVDNDHLSFAEITIRDENYTNGHDELLFTDTSNINGFFDKNTGKLSLIGYATLPEYSKAIRSVTYNYRLSETENGSAQQILPETKTIFLQIHDGQVISKSQARNIVMETTVSLNIPTAFTPNGDTANEKWNVQALSNAHQCDDAVIRVYNKRGLLLFQAIGLEEKWDGTFRGEVLPMDVYYYTIDLNLSYTKRTYKGVVTLLR